MHRLLPALLVLAIATAVGPSPKLVGRAAAAPEATTPLATAIDDTSATLTAPHFRLHWSTRAGGDLTAIGLFDGDRWRELLGATHVRQSVPGLRLVAAEGDFRSLGETRIEWLEQGEHRAVLAVENVPTTPDGVASPFRVRQTWTVYAEGAVFVDLDIELPAGAPDIELERSSMGWPIAPGDLDLHRWHWRQSSDRGGIFLEPERSFKATPCPQIGLALGRDGEFVHHVQMVLEHSRAIGESSLDAGALIANGTYFIYHLRPQAAGATTLSAPFRYTNRWGLLLGRQPAQDPLHGQRLVYWQEGGESAMAYPSLSAIEAMAQCGASGIVLGPGWRRAAGTEGPLPIDGEALAGMIADAHAFGLRVLVYALPQGDPLELATWARGMGIDGFFLDQISPHLHLVGGEVDEYPARATFEWGHALREAFGPGGLLIGRSGVAGPDLAMALVVPGVVYGTELGQWKSINDPLKAYYLGGQGYGIPCPLPIEMKLRSTRALSVYAASAAVPLVPLGWGEERAAYRAASWVMPLWQVYRTLPMGEHVRVRSGQLTGLVESSNPRFRSQLYQLSPDILLLVTANQSLAPADSSTLRLDYQRLGIDGAYAVEEIRAVEMGEFESIYLGRSPDGLVHTSMVARFGVRGFLFVRGDYPFEIGRALDEIAQLARAFSDDAPPSTPEAPAVTAAGAELRLSWSPAHDRHHVEAYRVFRSPQAEFDASLVQDLGLVWETTRFRDLGAKPGQTYHYAVAAVDQAGNVGLPSESAAGEVSLPGTVITFADTTDARRFEVIAGSWAHHQGGFEHGRKPDAERVARAVFKDESHRDVDMTVRISSPGGYQYSGGLLFAANEAGEGYVLYLGDPAKSRLVLATFDGQILERIAEAHYPYVTREGGRRTLQVKTRGDRIIGICDGHVLIDVLHTSGRRGDRVGLMASSGHVRFDVVAIADNSSSP
jgi:hypothetical protein